MWGIELEPAIASNIFESLKDQVCANVLRAHLVCWNIVTMPLFAELSRRIGWRSQERPSRYATNVRTGVDEMILSWLNLQPAVTVLMLSLIHI